MTTNVLIVGAGPAALEAALALRHHAADRVELTLVAPEEQFVYRPVSVVDPFALGPARRYPLRSIAEDLGASLVASTVAAVDPAAHRVRLTAGSDLDYDVLLIAVGARPRPALAHATTFTGPDDVEALHGLVQDVELGYIKRLAFVVPPGTTWPLPLYELALMTANRAASMFASPDVHLVTPEAAPLDTFGPRASSAVRELVAQAGITLHTGAAATVEHGAVLLQPSGERIAVDRVVALPALTGPAIAGVPGDADGFIPVDELGAVRGLRDVYAAGDATDFPIKQGGIATQQADAVAGVIAARAGAPVTPQPFEPVLRGMLLTESRAVWLRDEAAAAGEDAVSARGLWWPPTKIAGRWLGRYLLGRDEEAAAGSTRTGLPIEVRLDQRARRIGSQT